MVQLISLQTLKDNYLIDNNMDDKYLISNINKCQDFILKPLLGLKYTEIYNQIDNGTLTQPNRDLLTNYVEQVIAYFVMSEVLFTVAYKFKNQPTEEKNNLYTFRELIDMSNKYKSDSEHYAAILKDFMEDTSIIKGEDYEFNSGGIFLGNTKYEESPYYNRRTNSQWGFYGYENSSEMKNRI